MGPKEFQRHVLSQQRFRKLALRSSAVTSIWSRLGPVTTRHSTNECGFSGERLMESHGASLKERWVKSKNICVTTLMPTRLAWQFLPARGTTPFF
jgi:hypothetical protein